MRASVRLSHAMQDALRRLQDVAYQEAGMRGALVGVVVDERWGDVIGIEPGDATVVRVVDGAKLSISCEAKPSLIERVEKLEEAAAKWLATARPMAPLRHVVVDARGVELWTEAYEFGHLFAPGQTFVDKGRTFSVLDCTWHGDAVRTVVGPDGVVAEMLAEQNKAALAVDCPTCLAITGVACRSTLGNVIVAGCAHAGRVHAAVGREP